jgi:dihydroflavonol-4-reductase
LPVLVTGATGFVGNHVARALLKAGAQVRVLVRPTSRLDLLSDLTGVEKVVGDLRDKASLDKAAAGCAEVFHVAADYRFDVRDPEELHRSNVEGTRNLLEASANAGVRRVVYTSTVGCIGFPKGGLGTEETPVSLDDMVGAYKRTKFLAEREALNAVKRGVPVVIVNPTAPVGEGDLKPTPTGAMIVNFLRGKMFAVVDTGLNLIDVRDCAAGHLAAAEKGRVGERYILGCRNLSLLEIMQTLSKVAGGKAPRMKIPHFVALSAAYVDTTWSRLRGKEPFVSLEGVRMARKTMWVDAAKAVSELGLPQTDPEEPLRRAAEWFRARRYV